MSAGVTSVSELKQRRAPALRTVLREELIMVGRRWTHDKPWPVTAGWLLLLLYFLADSRMGPLLPYWLGFALGMAPWNNRLLGRGVEWELPVRRAVLNRLRVVGGLVGVFGVVALLTPFVVYFGDSVWSRQPTTVMAVSVGAGILGFTGGFILGLLTRAQKSGVFMIGFVLVMLVGLLPVRYQLRILPEASHPAFTGSYGLHTFTGRLLFEIERVAPGKSHIAWSPENWLISASIWATICTALLFVLSALHQE